DLGASVRRLLDGGRRCALLGRRTGGSVRLARARLDENRRATALAADLDASAAHLVVSNRVLGSARRAADLHRSPQSSRLFERRGASSNSGGMPGRVFPRYGKLSNEARAL